MGFKAQTCWTELLVFWGVWNHSRILIFGPDWLFSGFPEPWLQPKTYWCHLKMLKEHKTQYEERKKKPTDLDLHCLPLSMWIYSNNSDQVIWLAENKTWAWHLNLFSRERVNTPRVWNTENIFLKICKSYKHIDVSALNCLFIGFGTISYILNLGCINFYIHCTIKFKCSHKLLNA